MRKICLIAVALLLIVSVQQAWAAPPALPATFYGSVRIDGVSVPAGSYVLARIEGTSYSVRVPVRQDSTHGVVYVVDLLADNPETPTVEGGKEGDKVVFVVELPGGSTRTMMQRGVWHSGRSMALHLDTSIDAVIPLVFSRP